ncbi:GntR family transcriptional regulator [Streptomyces tubbatahanensis]|uniref:GntR family transcriptional regulator n=1 Tax=Streptomyces tubbatahanensis TaxID=2923272 RepID=A0ABY3XM42_9ACTN|nr:GntR family transcriptional regulator [Streptomyces tubbatahanensis]UNS95465.1 GntR family transcriptional regulator [Streptomyces tubbatahanensis]
MPRQGDRRHSPRVKLYQRIVAAIDDGTFPPGAKLPPEPELAAQLGVSRSGLREVLILLQEDGVITRRQGSGSVVNQPPPAPGLERLLPVETLLGPGARRCRRLAVEWEEPTDFSGYHLRMAPAERACFWETVVDVDGAPACFAHEWAADESALRAAAGPALVAALGTAPAGPGPTAAGATAAGAGDRDGAADASEKPEGGAKPGGRGAPRGSGSPDGREPGCTMLAAFLHSGAASLLTARSTLGATVLGTERGRAVSRPPETPALLLTQTVTAAGRPVMAAKYLFPAGAPLLSLTPRR